MDQFEDFEFKPITEGLGFYKKSEELKQEKSRAALGDTAIPREIPRVPDSLVTPQTGRRPAEQSLKEIMKGLPPSMDFERESGDRVSAPTPASNVKSDIEMYPALTRKPATPWNSPASHTAPASGGGAEMIRPVPAAPTSNRALQESLAKAFPQRDLVKKSGAPEVQAAPAVRPMAATQIEWRPIPHAILAGLLDLIIVSSLSLSALASLVAITNVDLFSHLENPATAVSAFVQLVILFVGVLQVYFLVSRSLMKMTLGDWAFEIRLGTEEQQRSLAYPFQVLWRSLLNMITGFVLLPFLSLISRRDVASYLTGLQLYQRRN